MQHRPRLRPRATIVSSTLVAAGAIGLAVLTASPAQAAPTASTASLEAPATATVGTPFDVDLTIPATADVYAYEITLDLDTTTYRAGSLTGPDGGFDSAEQDGDVLTIVHTRLGTSPALDGDIETSVSLAPTAVGSADLGVTRITLVDDAGATTVLTDPAAATVTVAAAPTATPTPTAIPTPGATAPAGPGADPTDTPSDPKAGAVPAASGGGTPAGGALAWTGADVTPWIAASLALLAAGGTLITLRARRARSERTGAAE